MNVKFKILTSMMTPLGFEFKRLTNREIYGLQREWTEEVIFWRKEKLLRVMAVLNAYIYHAAIASKALKKTEYGRLSVNQAKLQQLAQCKITFTVTTTGLQTYLKQWWDLTSREDEAKGVRANTLRSLRDILSKTFKLFTYTSKVFGSTRKSPDLIDFDISRSLVLYELLEQVLMEKFAPATVMDARERLRAMLPSHLGYCCVKLFNALFAKMRSFMRKEPQPYDDEEIERPSEGRKWLDREFPGWEKHYEPQYKTDEPATLTPELLQELEDDPYRGGTITYWGGFVPLDD